MGKPLVEWNLWNFVVGKTEQLRKTWKRILWAGGMLRKQVWWEKIVLNFCLPPSRMRSKDMKENLHSTSKNVFLPRFQIMWIFISFGLILSTLFDISAFSINTENQQVRNSHRGMLVRSNGKSTNSFLPLFQLLNNNRHYGGEQFNKPVNFCFVSFPSSTISSQMPLPLFFVLLRSPPKAFPYFALFSPETLMLRVFSIFAIKNTKYKPGVKYKQKIKYLYRNEQNNVKISFNQRALNTGGISTANGNRIFLAFPSLGVFHPVLLKWRNNRKCMSWYMIQDSE